MLNAVAIEKNYGDVVALRGADLSVDAGEVVSLLGRNGAGKSTLLSTIAGLLEPDAGQVTIGGIDVWKDPAAAAPLIGIAPQETGIYRSVTVRDNLAFFAELSGLRRGARDKRVDEVAEQLSLTALLPRKSTQLSGGEARRLHTACALVHRPKLLLLDEPTVGADVATRNELIAVVRQLAADGAAVVYTTHYLPEVEALAADIVVIDDGAVLARGTQQALIDQYRTEGVEIEFDRELVSDHLPNAVQLGPVRWRINDANSIDQAVALVADVDAQVVGAQFIRPDLERVFLAITGHALDSDASNTNDKEEEAV